MARRNTATTSGSLISCNNTAPKALSAASRSPRLRNAGQFAGSRIRCARSEMQETSICCLLPNSAYSSRFETLARVAISSVLACAYPCSLNAPNAADRIRPRTGSSGAG